MTRYGETLHDLSVPHRAATNVCSVYNESYRGWSGDCRIAAAWRLGSSPGVRPFRCIEDDSMIAPTAKPTLYQGVRFRSRLEARWAVFLDALGAEWIYEPQVSGVSGYLPDFEIGNAYLEVKSNVAVLRDEDLGRFALFVYTAGKPLYLCIGEPGEWHNGKLDGLLRVLLFDKDTIQDESEPYRTAWWAECPTCGGIRVVPRGESICECPPVHQQLTSAMHAVRDASYVDAS